MSSVTNFVIFPGFFPSGGLTNAVPPQYRELTWAAGSRNPRSHSREPKPFKSAPLGFSATKCPWPSCPS